MLLSRKIFTFCNKVSFSAPILVLCLYSTLFFRNVNDFELYRPVWLMFCDSPNVTACHQQFLSKMTTVFEKSSVLSQQTNTSGHHQKFASQKKKVFPKKNLKLLPAEQSVNLLTLGTNDARNSCRANQNTIVKKISGSSLFFRGFFSNFKRTTTANVRFCRNWYTYLFLQGSQLNPRKRAKHTVPT